ncbi:MAG: hypothetical protein HY329_12715 [Chloroflexi bacterium]|nr:hypothetical protein [Chloroflexota bacterium]
MLRIYDRPNQPLALEAFTNIADPQQRADFAELAHQQELLLLCYDELLVHRRFLTVSISNQDELRELLSQAEDHLAATPSDRLDFDQAKRIVMESTDL